MALTARGVRRKIPVPVIRSHGLGLILGSAVLVIGFAWLFDAFDGQGREMPFPFGAITPW
jgi:hypothetical protein